MKSTKTLINLFMILLVIISAGCINTEDTSSNTIPVPTEYSHFLNVHIIDVGQGDAILLEHNGKTMLIDGGDRNKGTAVTNYLKNEGITSLDYVVATHPHADHIGGLVDVVQTYPVGMYIDNGIPHTSKTYESLMTLVDKKDIPYHTATRGEIINLSNDVSLIVLNPGPNKHTDMNEDSIVLKLNYGNFDMLLMGDAGIETEKELLIERNSLIVDILKIGHHGSTSATGTQFLSATRSRMLIICVGENNDYGHPHSQVMDRIALTGAKLFRTDQHGNILIKTNGDIIKITTTKGTVEPYYERGI